MMATTCVDEAYERDHRRAVGALFAGLGEIEAGVSMVAGAVEELTGRLYDPALAEGPEAGDIRDELGVIGRAVRNIRPRVRPVAGVAVRGGSSGARGARGGSSERERGVLGGVSGPSLWDRIMGTLLAGVVAISDEDLGGVTRLADELLAVMTSEIRGLAENLPELDGGSPGSGAPERSWLLAAGFDCGVAAGRDAARRYLLERITGGQNPATVAVDLPAAAPGEDPANGSNLEVVVAPDGRRRAVKHVGGEPR